MESRKRPGVWKRHGKSSLDFWFSGFAYWLRVKADTVRKTSGTSFIVMKWNTLDLAELYSSDGVLLQRTGDRLPFSLWPVPLYAPAFSISLRTGDNDEYYIRLKSDSIMSFPVFLQDLRGYLISERNYLSVMYVLSGMFLLFILYNIVLELSIRESMYFWFILKTCILAITIFIGYGGAYALLWPGFPAWQKMSQSFFEALLAVSGSRFIRDVLSLKKNRPGLDRVLFGIAVAGLLMALASLSPLPRVPPVALLP